MFKFSKGDIVQLKSGKTAVILRTGPGPEPADGVGYYLKVSKDDLDPDDFEENEVPDGVQFFLFVRKNPLKILLMHLFC